MTVYTFEVAFEVAVESREEAKKKLQQAIGYPGSVEAALRQEVRPTYLHPVPNLPPLSADPDAPEEEQE